MINIENKHNFKFIVIGASGVGKTSILDRLVDDEFPTEQVSTIGVDYKTTVVEIDGQSIKLQIWDTAGQEKFHSISRSYFRRAVGVILVYDITDRKSFDELSIWLNDVHTLCDPNASVLMIGNKLDMASQRTVSTSEAQSFAATQQLSYIETSAKDGNNVIEAFNRAAKMVYDKAEAGILATKTSPNITAADDNSSSSCC